MELKGLTISFLKNNHSALFAPFKREMQRRIANNTTGTLTLTTSSTGEVGAGGGSNSLKYGGWAYSPDSGKVYGSPRNKPHIRWYKPSDDSHGTIAPAGFGASNKFLGTFYWRGFVYFLNYQFGAFVKMDTRPTLANGAVNPDYEVPVAFLTDTTGSDARYTRAKVVDSKAYLGKLSTGAVGFTYLDLATEELVNFGEPAFSVGKRYYPPVIADKSVYYIDVDTATAGANVIRYDLNTGTWTEILTPSISIAGGWISGKVYPDGKKIVWTPNNWNTCLILDLATQTFSQSNGIGSTTTSDGDMISYGGDGNIYCFPFDAPDGIRRFNPVTEVFDKPIADTAPPTPDGQGRMYVGAMAFEDDVLGLPLGTDHVAKLNLSGVTDFFHEEFVVSAHNNGY